VRRNAAADMTTIYLDHNIVHTSLAGSRGTMIVGAGGSGAIGVREWARAPAEELADRYADFYEGLVPFHSPVPDVIKREEQRKFPVDSLFMTCWFKRCATAKELLATRLVVLQKCSQRMVFLRVTLKNACRNPMRNFPCPLE